MFGLRISRTTRLRAIELAVVRSQFEFGSASGRRYPKPAMNATAADIDEQAGDRASAAIHRELSRATIRQLANSLPAEEPLRQTFLSAPAVAKILNRHP